MWSTTKTVLQIIWTAAAVSLSTLAGVVHGWERGWDGMIILGLVGFCLGAVVAAFPECLEVFA